MSPALPAAIETIADVRAVEAAAQRFETPCGAGRMVWRAWGDGDPVVLVHGGSGGWEHWARNIAPLVAAGRRVYACDLPGCGDSDRPPQGEDGDVLPQWIEEGAAALGLASFDLVGFSFGAMVSGFYTADHPARVRKLVLAGAPALTAERGPKVPLKEWLRLPDGPAREAALRDNLRLLMLARDESVDDLSVALYIDCLKRDRLTKRRMARTDVLLRTLPRVRAPIYGIWGAEDVLYRGRADIIDAGLKAAPDLRIIERVPRAGHWVQFEEAPTFNALLRDFLSE